MDGAGKQKAIGYIRVSTTEQSQEGLSLAVQRSKIKAYCALHGLELVEIAEDAGIDGFCLMMNRVQAIATPDSEEAPARTFARADLRQAVYDNSSDVP